MSHELGTKAAILFHENGQILFRSGWLDDSQFPTIAALAAAMIATGKSLNALGEGSDSPKRFSCDSDTIGLYTVAVGSEHWLAALYDQPLNPGQFRMKVRRYAETFARLGLGQEEQWELVAEPSAGVTMSPVGPEISTPVAKFTEKKSALFSNITDDEIDRLFENASS